MILPISITPCPIAEAVVEVRFDTDVPEDAVFGLVYNALKGDFPKSSSLPLASLPSEFRKNDPNLAHQPLHQLEGESLTVLVGAQAVSVGIRGPYPGWASASEGFRTVLARIANTGLIGKPQRFGLRYISFFVGDILQSLTLSLTINNDSISGEGTFLKTVLQAADCRMLLQVGKDLILVGEQSKAGSVIDIDSFVTEPTLTEGFEAGLAAFLEKAHLAEKQLFFKLLKPEFLNTLKPAFANED